jgi:hypothetical protein
MLRTLQIASSFGGSCRPTGGTRHPVQATARWLRQAATALRMISEAWDECVAAHHRYEQLMSWGVPHETAVREALGFGPAPAHERPQPTKSLG